MQQDTAPPNGNHPCEQVGMVTRRGFIQAGSLLAFSSAAGSSYAKPPEEADAPIIDAHMHVWGNDDKHYLFPHPVRSKNLNDSQRAATESWTPFERQHLAELDRAPFVPFSYPKLSGVIQNKGLTSNRRFDCHNVTLLLSCRSDLRVTAFRDPTVHARPSRDRFPPRIRDKRGHEASRPPRLHVEVGRQLRNVAR